VNVFDNSNSLQAIADVLVLSKTFQKSWSNHWHQDHSISILMLDVTLFQNFLVFT